MTENAPWKKNTPVTDNRDNQIRKGQALNAAFAEALAHNKSGDIKYIYSKFLYYYDLIQLIQSSDIETIKAALGD